MNPELSCTNPQRGEHYPWFTSPLGTPPVGTYTEKLAMEFMVVGGGQRVDIPLGEFDPSRLPGLCLGRHGPSRRRIHPVGGDQLSLGWGVLLTGQRLQGGSGER